MKTKRPQRIVVKLGTGQIVNEKFQLQSVRLKKIVDQIAKLNKSGTQVVLVSSGAIGLAKGLQRANKKVSGVAQNNLTLEQKQACAAIGQPQLMSHYIRLFSAHKVQVAQVLLTTNDLSHRESYLNLRRTLDELLRMGVVPIINENDCVSTQELIENQEKIFGDNDVLSALVASKIEADQLVILTDVAGVFDKNPKLHRDAKVISVLTNIKDIVPLDTAGKSQLGRGGMETKLKAVKIASVCGIKSVIASGQEPQVLIKVAQGKDFNGTSILPQGGLPNQKKWLGFSKTVTGVVVVNAGAQEALEGKRASLLPVGVVQVHGEFKSGDLISVQNENQFEIARGLSKYASADLKRVLGLHKNEIKNINASWSEELIHRDYLVVFKELYS